MITGSIPALVTPFKNGELDLVTLKKLVEWLSLVRFGGKVGADAALVVTPYYNKPTQAGMIAHYTALHDCCTLPIVIYNIPGRSVVDMSPETMGVLAKLPRIIGVKDATGKIERVS